MKIILSILVSLLMVSSAWAKKSESKASKDSESGWYDPQGKPLENAPERKIKNGFGGWIILTDDMNWEKEWNTKPDHKPTFKLVKDTRRGRIMELLITFSNPKVDANGNAIVKSDVALVRPDGKVDIFQTDAPCFAGKPHEKNMIAMCGDAIRIVMDNTDSFGDYKLEVLLKDTVGNTVLDLSTSFKLKK